MEVHLTWGLPRYGQIDMDLPCILVFDHKAGLSQAVTLSEVGIHADFVSYPLEGFTYLHQHSVASMYPRVMSPRTSLADVCQQVLNLAAMPTHTI